MPLAAAMVCGCLLSLMPLFRSTVEIPSGFDLLHVAGADDKIPERLVFEPFARVMAQHGVEGAENGLFPDVLKMHPVEPLAVEAAAEIKVVLARCPPAESDLRDVGPRTAIRAAAHADGDGLIGQVMAVEKRLNPGQKRRQVALALRHGETAGRQCDAGHRIEPQGALPVES